MKINKINRILMVLLFSGCFIGGCGITNIRLAPAISTQAMTETMIEQSDFRWQITLLSSEIRESLQTAGTTTLYDGTIKEIVHDDAPQKGKVFLLLDMSVEKAQLGNSSFDWDKVVILDEMGNEYLRHENDSFLINHKYERLPATSLKIGTTAGWVCFEVDSVALQGKLYLLHRAEEGENRIPIK